MSWMLHVLQIPGSLWHVRVNHALPSVVRDVGFHPYCFQHPPLLIPNVENPKFQASPTFPILPFCSGTVNCTQEWIYLCVSLPHWLAHYQLSLSELEFLSFPVFSNLPYCGWKQSCTLDGWKPINNGINHSSTAGQSKSTSFGPSSVIPIGVVYLKMG